MVGFPGETERDHEATVQLVRDLPFTYLHVFPYSQRPDAPAGRLGRPVAPEVARRRAAALRALAEHKGRRYRRQRAAEHADVVLLRRVEGRFEGLTGDYLTIYLPTDRPLPPRFVAVLSETEDGDSRVERAGVSPAEC